RRRGAAPLRARGQGRSRLRGGAREPRRDRAGAGARRGRGGDFRAALRIDPDLVVARLDLARALVHRGRRDPRGRERLWAAARREYLHLLEANPDVAEAHHDLGFMAYEAGAYAEALERYGRAVALQPAYAEALHGECIALARLGRCAEGARACRRCLEASPQSDSCSASL